MKLLSHRYLPVLLAALAAFPTSAVAQRLLLAPPHGRFAPVAALRQPGVLAPGPSTTGEVVVRFRAEVPDQRRDALVQTCKDWLDTLATAARITVHAGHFRADVEPEQFAFEVYSIMLGFHTYQKFLREPASLERARGSLERLLCSARARARPAPRARERDS